MNKEIQKETKAREKCFVIMPISDPDGYPPGHFEKVYKQIIVPAIGDAGYEAYRVDDNKISDSIIEKIFSAIQDCPMAICDLSSRNPNVLYELGVRQAYDKPVVLIKDEITDRIFDVSGITTVEYSSSRLYEAVMTARNDITDAIIATKGNLQKESLVSILKTRKAMLSDATVTKDDTVGYALNLIQNELKSIKRELGNNFNNPESISRDYFAHNNRINTRGYEVENKSRNIFNELFENNDEKIRAYLDLENMDENAMSDNEKNSRKRMISKFLKEVEASREFD